MASSIPHPIACERQSYSFRDAVHEVYNNNTPVEEAAEKLVSQLNDDEKLSLLDGDEPFWKGFRDLFFDRFNRVPYSFGAIPRLGIPGILFSDGPRGVVMGSSTAFPVSMARGATWDTTLERRVGDAIGLEAKAQGANFYSGVCINLPRHSAWGRCQEVYGEDPIVLGEFGRALMQGVQRHIMACVKHFALNSMENARFKVDVEVEDDVLHEVYLPHFRRVVEGGVASVMSSYNSVNGEFAGQSERLLDRILRKTWGFDGFVISDFIWGLRDPVLSVKVGLDIETPFRQQRYYSLKNALQFGELVWNDVDKICHRIIKRQLQFAKTVENNKPNLSVVFSREHRALAREVASRSIVLLRNEPVNDKPLLPLDPSNKMKISIVGRLANSTNTGDRGSSHVWSPHVVSPYEGLMSAFPNAEVVLEDTGSIAASKKAAVDADVVICVVGYDEKDEGEYAAPTLMKDTALRALFPPAVSEEEKQAVQFLENSGPREKDIRPDSWEIGAGGDRRSLRLPAQDVELITAVAAINPRTVVSVVCGGAVIVEDWKQKVPAILMSWYAGCEGGHGLMDVLTGRVPASGRLPFVIPTDERHLPEFDIDATKIKYDRWFGQALLDKLGVLPAYPFGFGLSYTTFSARNLRLHGVELASAEESFHVYAMVKNTGVLPGRYVAQVYGRPSLVNLPSRLLLGFQTIDLQVGEEAEVDVIASIRPLQQWQDGRFVLQCGKLEIEMASYSGDPEALREFCYLSGNTGD